MFSVMVVCHSVQRGWQRDPCTEPGPDLSVQSPAPTAPLYKGPASLPFVQCSAPSPDMIKLVQLGPHWTGTPPLASPTHSNLFTMKHGLSASGRWAFD